MQAASRRSGKVCGPRKLCSVNPNACSDCAFNDEPNNRQKLAHLRAADLIATPCTEDRMKTKHPRHIQRGAALVFAAALLAAFTGVRSPVCIGQDLPAPAGPAPVEQLPPSDAAQLNGPALPKECEPAPSDNPLFTLTTDIRPRTPDGEVVPADQLPFNCAGLKPIQQKVMSTNLSCDTCYPGYCDLLSMARFCHKPLYFNDDCLERYGVESCCCQPCASALCFYGGALLMPVRACCVCPCSCVPSGGCCR
jgi:hypothetical protein